MSRSLLIVDDDPQMREMLVDAFGASGYAVRSAHDKASALAAMREDPPELLLTDLRLGKDDGLDVCRDALQIVPGMPVIVMTGFGSMEAAIGAIRAGAYDFVKKPVDLDALELVIERALRHLDLTRELERLQSGGSGTRSKLILGESSRIKAVTDLLERIADTDTSVLVTGQSGTGKELVARSLHESSSRRDAKFVAVNCAALPAALLESELFGHKKGAFTDARRDRDGLFVEAHNGTLFLDEIGEMPMEMQVKLLRALQEQSVRPVGASQEVRFDTRVVTATNRDLEEEVEAGRFREDLYYRINVVRVKLPPLRARGADALLLAQHFVEDIAARLNKAVIGISEAAAHKLLSYDWPGNVRELRNAMERAVALTRFDKITPEDLPERISAFTPTKIAVFEPHAEDLPTLAQLEDRYIRHVLERVEGNKSRAAEILGLGRSTLYRRLERLEADGE